MSEEAIGRHEHDHDLQVLDQADHAGLVVLVAQLAAGGAEKQERQDEQCPDHQAGHGGRQPLHAELVGDHYGKRELEQVVVRCARELGPEKRRKTLLSEQGELVGVLGRVANWSVVERLCSSWFSHTNAPFKLKGKSSRLRLAITVALCAGDSTVGQSAPRQPGPEAQQDWRRHV